MRVFRRILKISNQLLLDEMCVLFEPSRNWNCSHILYMVLSTANALESWFRTEVVVTYLEALSPSFVSQFSGIQKVYDLLDELKSDQLKLYPGIF